MNIERMKQQRLHMNKEVSKNFSVDAEQPGMKEFIFDDMKKQRLNMKNQDERSYSNDFMPSNRELSIDDMKKQRLNMKGDRR